MDKKPRILVVDDEPALLMMAQKRLQVAGYDVLTASDGRTGLAKAQQDKPDLIILDLMLPELNGFEVCILLKQDTRYQDIPIVMFSARTQEKDKQTGMECGADAYITKPYELENLLGRVRALLRH